MTDPFASNPWDNDVPTSASPTSPWDDVPTTTTKEAPTVTAPTVVNAEGKVVVTLKGGTGFDAPWVVIHAADVDDALAQVSDGKLPALLEQAQKASEFFAGKKAPTPNAKPQGGNQGGGNGRPAGAAQAPNGQSEYCDHGEMTFRSGVSEKTGKPWKGFFCPERDRSQQCSPKFTR